jgi:hypothetical protein
VTVRWLIVLVLTLVVIGLIAYARGQEHHHGDDVGALQSNHQVEVSQWLS